MIPEYNRTKRFPLTSIGCEEATEFLKSTGRLHLLNKELSTDGYTLIELANSLYEEDQTTQTTSPTPDPTAA